MRGDEEANLIHGLELQGRAVSPVTADTDNISFLVGTQSLRHDNLLYLVTMDEDSGQLAKRGFQHSAGEVWQVDASPTDTSVFCTTYGEKGGMGGWRKRAAVWRLPEAEIGEAEEGSSVPLELSLSLDTEKFGNDVCGAWWQPSDGSRLAMVVENKAVMLDTSEGEAREVWKCSHDVRGQSKVETGRWNPHRNCHQFATVCGSQVIAWDTREASQSWLLSSNTAVRSLDFNPNKQYYLATGGDDGVTSIWDTRSSAQPLLARRDHSHWVWSVRYNSFHDQLLLSAGSDAHVVLSSVASLSSEPYGHLVEEEGEEEEEGRVVIEDGVISVFSDHEDSVYTSEWSSADPWTFASLSYDGRLVIGHVPRAVKFKILNLV